MTSISHAAASELIDFAPTAQLRRQGFAEAQLQGAVAAYNILERNRIAYIADEVGMGKTYVALGAMALLRHVQPNARILVIGPRENLQRKWVKELGNFVRMNWLVPDNRVRSLQSLPAREATHCASLRDFVSAVQLNPDRDFYLRMTSFSLWTSEAKYRWRGRKDLLETLPWIHEDAIPTRDAHEYRVAYGRVLNEVLPEIDLLVVDEAHNLKHGLDMKGSTRNVLLGAMFGHPRCADPGSAKFGLRAKRVLFLSATPFEHDYADLWRQFDLFGFGDVSLLGPVGDDRLDLRLLADPDASDEQRRRVVERFLIRRVSGLTIGGKFHTKNMYRREWRRGGVAEHDLPMAVPDAKQRLVIGLVQKKVAEVLGDERVNNHFQIGMLSSFEAFAESATGCTWHDDDEDGDSGSSSFDSEQGETRVEKAGLDSHSLSHVVRSYQKRFGEALPHPKMDACVDDLAKGFETGEKALVFVRRIATMDEIKERLDDRYNAWLKAKMLRELPGLEGELQSLFTKFDAVRRRSDGGDLADVDASDGLDAGDERVPTTSDRGARDTFFAWFFRGEGPQGLLSGAAFQRNRLMKPTSAYATLFEEDLVSWMLGRPASPVEEIARRVGRPADDVRADLRRRAFAVFRLNRGAREGFARLRVFDAYQQAALEMLRDSGGEKAAEAEVVLRERFKGSAPAAIDVPDGFPGPQAGLGATTVPAVLARHPELERLLLPPLASGDFRERFVDRERRRELLSAMCRLGCAYIDLYLLAIRSVGSFELGKAADEDEPAAKLATAFVELLDHQRSAPGLHACRELSSAAEAFEELVSANFPDVRSSRVSELPGIYAKWLQSQAPVARPRRGGALARLVRQFRMPGYPLVLVTTDILQEGEDLHTFCRRVVHYGITWTPSAMEQRTGRVDRIGGLVQRRLDGREQPATEDEFIQVYYPYLDDTVELLQVGRVFERMNRFLQLMHRNLGAPPDESSKLDAKREFLALRRDIAAFREPLESAFPVNKAWLLGTWNDDRSALPALGALRSHVDALWSSVVAHLGVRDVESGRPFVKSGDVFLEGDRPKSFDLELRSMVGGEDMLLRCRSEVGSSDLGREDFLNAVYNQQLELGGVRLCARFDAKERSHVLTIEGALPFAPGATQASEVTSLVLRTVRAADQMERALFEVEEGPGRTDAQVRELARLRTYATDLCARSPAGFQLELKGDEIEGTFSGSNGVRRVRLQCLGNRYVMTSVVLDGKQVKGDPRGWSEMARIAWSMNASVDLVTFAFDENARLIGRVEHPANTLDQTEFDLYVLTLLRQCERTARALRGPS